MPAARLDSYARLVSWARAAGALGESDARLVARVAARRRAAAAAALRRALGLRAAISGVLSAVADRRLPRAGDLTVLNRALAGAGGAMRLEVRGERFHWAWADERLALERPLWLVARSAAELCTSGRLARVRQCPALGCGRLFLDTSRNRTRRWCDMRLCGNRAKARRHYARRRLSKVRSAGGKG